MKKLLILSIFTTIFSTSIFAKTYEGTYKISYGIFGELGIAKTTLEINDNLYNINIKAEATGIAKFLSNGKVEHYTSSGKIINDSFYSYKYMTKTKNNSKEKTKIYDFDYDKKIIYLDTTSKYLDTKLNMESDNLETTSKWITNNSKSTNSFFTTTDILSLFFNVTKNLKSMDKQKDYEYETLGAKAENGKINFYFPNDKAKKSLDDYFENKNEKLIVTLNQPIFSSKNGELFISVNNEGFCNKAILKDVLIFGDITGELIDFKIKD